MATILSVCQSLSAFIGIDRPDAVINSQEREHVEMTALANEVGKQIAEAYTWQRLKRLNTITGDGSTTAFDLPDDFGWIPRGQQLRSPAFVGPVEFVPDHDEWLRREVEGETRSTNGAWTVLGGQFLFNPAPTDAAEIKHYYQTSEWAEDGAGDAKDSFTSDDDSYRLDDQLFRLGMLWKWKAYKGLPYAEHLQEFGIELNKRVFYDRPRNLIAMGRPYGGAGGYGGGTLAESGGDVSLAFPYTLPFPVA